MTKFDLITVGACGIDILIDIHGKNKSIEFNKSTKKLLISSGDKIIVDGYKFSCGQNAANVAVGLTRLGLNSTVFAEIGSDEFAEKIIKFLKTDGVNTENIKHEKGDSSFSIVLDYNSERTIFAENIKRVHDFSFKNISSRFLYLTSLSRSWINAYIETLNFVTQQNIPFAFNPGTTQIEDRDKIIFDVIKKAEVLFINKEEAEILLSKKRSFTDINEKRYVKNLLAGFKEIGAKNTVITDAENGSYCLDAKGNYYYLHALSTPILEKTGAGDAYASGFLYGLINEKNTETCMIYGTINASSAIQRLGSQEGLLTRDILEEKASHLENFKTISI